MATIPIFSKNGGQFGQKDGGMFSLIIGMSDSTNPPPVKLDGFIIDKYEVTNKQFKVFVDSGGYRNRTYWKHGFIKDGKKLSGEEAMALSPSVKKF